jgi:membrane protein involved in colicin uptake
LDRYDAAAREAKIAAAREAQKAAAARKAQKAAEDEARAAAVQLSAEEAAAAREAQIAAAAKKAAAAKAAEEAAAKKAAAQKAAAAREAQKAAAAQKASEEAAAAKKAAEEAAAKAAPATNDESGYYATLGVNSNATDTEIKKAFHKLALKHHPDKGGDQEKFKRIKEAHEILSDPVKKKEYDNSKSPPDYGAWLQSGMFSEMYIQSLFKDYTVKQASDGVHRANKIFGLKFGVLPY